MPRGKEAGGILIAREESFEGQLFLPPAERQGVVEFAHPRIHQQVVCGGAVAGIRVGGLQAIG